MKACRSALLALSLTAACAAPAPEVLLETPQAPVTARVLREGGRWCVQDIEGVALVEPDLLGLHVRIFLDPNDDGAAEDGEERGAWHASRTR